MSVLRKQWTFSNVKEVLHFNAALETKLIAICKTIRKIENTTDPKRNYSASSGSRRQRTGKKEHTPRKEKTAGNIWVYMSRPDLQTAARLFFTGSPNCNNKNVSFTSSSWKHFR